MGSSSICSARELALYLYIFLTYLATIFTWFSAFDCNFFQVDYGFFGFFPANVPRGFGIWTVLAPPKLVVANDENGDSLNDDGATFVAGSCQLYHTVADSDLLMDNFNSSFRFSRAVSMMAMVLSIFSAVLATATLFSKKKSYLFAQAILMLFICVLVILEFFALGSDLCRVQINCQISSAGTFGIVAAVLWFVTGIFSLFVERFEDREIERRRLEEERQAAASRLDVKNGGDANNSCSNDGEQANTNPVSDEAAVATAAGKTEEDGTSVTDFGEAELEENDGRMETISLEDK